MQAGATCTGLPFIDNATSSELSYLYHLAPPISSMKPKIAYLNLFMSVIFTGLH
jgi:hypothetical protein